MHVVIFSMMSGLLRASGCTWDDTKHALSRGNAIKDYYRSHQRADQAITESSTQQLRSFQHKRPNSPAQTTATIDRPSRYTKNNMLLPAKIFKSKTLAFG